MTTTYFEVTFSLCEISINQSFCTDGGGLVLNKWEDCGDGSFIYLAETQVAAKAALHARIEESQAFLAEAELKYA